MEQHIENPERAQCTASPVGVETDQDEGQGLAVVAVATAVAGGRGKIGAASTAGLRRGACLPILGPRCQTAAGRLPLR